MIRWKKFKDLIVPVVEFHDEKLATSVSYIIFKEQELDMSSLYAKLEKYKPMSREIKLSVQGYLRKLRAYGLIEFDDGIISISVPPIPFALFSKALEEKEWEVMRKLRVSKHTIKAWKKGEYFPNNENFKKLIKVIST